MANRGQAYGMSAELEAKKAAKFNPQLEAEAKTWLEQLSGESCGDASFADWLKSGDVLCKAMNKLKPSPAIKINASKMAFKQMENIGNFLKVAEAYGVKANDLFQTVDLYEAQNMPKVIDGIHALGRAAQRNKFDGPVIGVKEADAAPRNFDEKVLKAGEAIAPLQAGFTGGANQAGMNFGNTRHIID
eukprot:m.33429 g.33429  ORF g.33429 m.33429 type:complete len:188 (+) comp8537_c0_seq1:62-625(+)